MARRDAAASTRPMQGPRDDFVACVYKDDYRAIQKRVQHYPNIETGGDLFGLWKDEKTVVIQLFIGPGKDCERTTASFHQDVDYLSKVGSLITTKDGLCNVGEWHSHHQIGMPGPSGADKRTVFGNMPQLGLQRFVLFIATIESKLPSGKRSHGESVEIDQIKLRCFLFLDSTQELVPGRIHIIEGSNPHRLNTRALQEIEAGAEPAPPPPQETLWKERKSSDEKERNAGKTRQHEVEATLASQNTQGNPTGEPARNAQGGSPPRVSRETKPQDHQHPNENPQNDQQQQHRRQPVEGQGASKNEIKSNQPHARESNENVSPNAGFTQPMGNGTQSSAPPSHPTSQMPQYLTQATHTGTAETRRCASQRNGFPPNGQSSSQILQDAPFPPIADQTQSRGRGRNPPLNPPSTSQAAPYPWYNPPPPTSPRFNIDKITATGNF